MAQNMDVSTELSDNEEFHSTEGGTYLDDIYIPPPIETVAAFDPTTPRLIITKIENDFFKSYAKGQTLGPFHKCFNAVVGPNGSGKSNVIDSLLFVFGYRASRIRCKKLCTLIHDSERHTNVQSCTVAIHFVQIIDKEGDDYEVIPGSAFCISKTVFKDNTSNYYWDGKKVQFKQVAELLKKMNVDLEHNRFLILQGEVEQISMMECKGAKDGDSGMLEYLEDIIGTSRYIKPLEEVNQRVEVISEKMTERLNRLKIFENELSEMRGPMEEAVKFLKTENTIAKSHNFLYQKAMKETKEKASDEIVKHQEVVEMQRKYIDQLNELKDKKKEQNEEFDQEVQKVDKLKKQKDSLKKTFDISEKKDVQLMEEMNDMNKRRKEIKAQIESDRKKLIKLENLPEENEKSIKEIQQKLENSTNEKVKHEEEKTCMIKNIQRETEGLQKQKEELEKELAVLRENQATKKTAFDLAETELKMCIGNEESAKQKLQSLETERDRHKNTIEEKGRQLHELKKKIPASREELNEANKELLRVKQEEVKLVGEMRNKSSMLEEGRSSMQATRSKGKVLDALMRARSEGQCPGLLGRLGDLGAIDAKYDVAVSMACGALDNIVVDTVDCAQWCINFLKKYDLGRASFIALEKQEHLRRFTEARIETPENVPRLFDLIQVADNRVKTAFYYGLRDTLVAQNLDQAQRVAYGSKRYRVVTLSGDTIEIVGTMSGGGKRVIRGKMGQNVQQTAQVDPIELRQMEEELREMEGRVRELRQRQIYLEGRIQELQPMLRNWEIDENNFSKEMKTAQELLPNLLRQLKEQGARAQAIKTDQKQVNKLTAIMEEKKAEFEEAAETTGELQVKVDKLTAQIKEKSSGKRSKIDKLIKDCAKNIDVCKKEITRLQVSMKTAKREYTSTTVNISRLEKDLENTEKNMRQIKEERDKMEVEGKEILEKIGQLAEQIEEREEVLVELKKGLDKFTKEETKLKSEKVDVDEKLKVLDKKMQELNSTIQSYQRKLAGLKLHEIDKEELEELKKFTDEEIETQDANLIEKELVAAENHIKAAKPNLNAINEYRRKEAVYSEKALELHQISEKRTQMRTVYDDLRQRRKDEFTRGYNIIKMKLKEMYQLITMGGDAELELVDTYDPFTEGIQFNVRPPRKTWKRISNLSGGEKTLSSLALVFALHYYKPSPLYVMDEIDAALDFKNVSIVAHYIKERTKNAQFIVISLRYNMFELSDLLIGIYKTQDTSKSITYDHRRVDGARPSTQNPPAGFPQIEEIQVDAEEVAEEQSEELEE